MDWFEPFVSPRLSGLTRRGVALMACLLTLIAASLRASDLNPHLTGGLKTEHLVIHGQTPMAQSAQNGIAGIVAANSFHSPTVDHIGRWSHPICPKIFGMPADDAKFIVNRLLEVAQEVGAPVARDRPCKANIEIVFTADPQSLMNQIAA